MRKTAVHVGKTAISYTCIETQEMSSTTEMNSLQVAHRTMAGDLNDQTGTGDEISGADAVM